MKEGESDCRGSEMAGQTMDDSTTELLGIFRNLKSSDVWKTLQDHWKMYQRKHYNKSDSSQDDN